MDLGLDRFNSLPSDTGPGMNLISADFDLVMVNRVNERLYGKPMVELLGKKCYREFEKREAPCPHCPGRLSLISGETHEAETEGRRDDGTWFSARVRTHPVQGPDNEPNGFIEVVEDITEEKRSEKLARIDSDLQTALSAADTIQKALLDCLEAALRVEGVDAGCIFSVDWTSKEISLAFQRNFSPDYVATLSESGLGSAMTGELPSHLTRIPGAPRAGELVPIVHRGKRVALMVVGAYVYSTIPPSLRAGLHGLGATAGNAVSRILAERSRGDAIADLEAFINVAPLATWLIDPDGRLTMWNRAAECLLGWSAHEVLGRKPPFAAAGRTISAPGGRGATTSEVTLLTKGGSPLDVRLTIAPFRDIVGNSSANVVMAEDLSLKKRLVAIETGRDAGSSTSMDPDGNHEAACPDGADDTGRGSSETSRGGTLLLIDGDPRRNAETAQSLTRVGWDVAGCSCLADAARLLESPDGAKRFTGALIELISPDGANGIQVKAELRARGMDAPVIICSDADVLGYEFHGFAGSIRRPCAGEALKSAIELALETRS